MLGLGMGLGMGQNVAASGGGGGAAWSPTTPAQTLTAWYDPTDITTLFKDTAATVAVTADGDIVRAIKGKGGVGPTLTMPYGPSSGPIYRTGSGKPYLESNGTQWLETSTNVQLADGTTGAHTCGAAVVFTNNTGNQDLFIHNSGGVNRIGSLLRNVAGTSQTDIIDATFSTTYTDTGPSITAGSATTLIETTSSSAIENFVNNSSNGSTAPGGSIAHSSANIGLLGSVGNAGTFTGKFYGLAMWSGVLSSGDRASFHTWLAAKM